MHFVCTVKPIKLKKNLIIEKQGNKKEIEENNNNRNGPKFINTTLQRLKNS